MAPMLGEMLLPRDTHKHFRDPVRVFAVPVQPPPVGAGTQPHPADLAHQSNEFLQVGSIDLPRVGDHHRPSLRVDVGWGGPETHQLIQSTPP